MCICKSWPLIVCTWVLEFLLAEPLTSCNVLCHPMSIEKMETKNKHTKNFKTSKLMKYFTRILREFLDIKVPSTLPHCGKNLST